MADSDRGRLRRRRPAALHVTLINRQKRPVPKARLVRIAKGVMWGEGCAAGTEVAVVIGGDRWIRRLNREYKGRDRPTDVLAFPHGEPACGGLLGDVAVSAETAERQAKALGHTLAHELAVLVAHGVLHLTGWTDETPTKRRRMMERVEEALRLAGAPPRS